MSDEDHQNESVLQKSTAKHSDGIKRSNTLTAYITYSNEIVHPRVQCNWDVMGRQYRGPSRWPQQRTIHYPPNDRRLAVEAEYSVEVKCGELWKPLVLPRLCTLCSFIPVPVRAYEFIVQCCTCDKSYAYSRGHSSQDTSMNNWKETSLEYIQLHRSDVRIEGDHG